MEEDGQVETVQYFRSTGMVSPEIVEIGDDSRSMTGGRDGTCQDVYVAVGKDDLGVVKWVLDHLVTAASGRVFLVHVFPPITHIPTPVGKLSRSQLSQDQVRVYINEETNRRRNLLQKYIRLCSEAKVTVDTMLIESNSTAKAVLDLIPVLNITSLVIGTKRSPHSRRLVGKLSKGEFVKRNAPECCEVTIVFNGQKVIEINESRDPNRPSMRTCSPGDEASRHPERRFFECPRLKNSKNPSVKTQEASAMERLIGSEDSSWIGGNCSPERSTDQEAIIES
ncbi:hypothetical protein CDL15_Pgr014830 [Punica granatum]|uniref:U-box domain-containing protein 33-like n=1 Tax=Punica granatum TaxID=22663 RepID=A0A218XZP2_PUNGR|nr:hypothetical protein CDL15_Pgr014830 [Punica granatum]